MSKKATGAGFRNCRGSIIVEFVLTVVVMSVLINVLLVFGRAAVTRQRALSAARFGTSLQASALITDTIVNQQLQDLFTAIAADRVRWQWEIGRFTDTPTSTFYWLMKTVVKAEYRPGLLSQTGLGVITIEEKSVSERDSVL